MIVGTAGHIDHGKTSLIRRLTGKDTDRLPEEKRRGISIELGYAYLPVAAAEKGPDRVIGFIDVPGHERFVHAMVSGATGIDLALMVIAADDGPMPQTREHLEILRQLGITRGAIVLTKIDSVDPPAGDLAVASIADVVAGQSAEKWPLFPVSSITGEGIDALRDFLIRESAVFSQRARGGAFRLAVDRAFSLSGIGTIVTGTAHAGSVAVGDEVQIVSPFRSAPVQGRVRSIHAQDRTADVGHAGQRLALNLAGVSVEEAERGSWVNGQELEHRVNRFDMLLNVSGQHDRVIHQGLEVHLHHGSADLMARVYPLNAERVSSGEACFASVVMSQPISVCRGDRLVLRDSQAQTTLGGGRVLDVYPPNRGKRTAQRLGLLDVLAREDDVVCLSETVACGPVPIAHLIKGWNMLKAQADTLVAQAGLVAASGVVFHPERWALYAQRLLQALDDTHAREPEMPGLELNRARRVAAPQLETAAFDELVDHLLAQGKLERKGAFLSRPGHKIELAAAELNLWKSIAPLLDESPYNPPRVRDIAKLTNIPEAEIRANLRRVARVGEVALVALDHFFLVHRVDEMARIVAELFDQHGTVRAADFRDRIGGGRKVAIQILEFFDRVGYTRRLRDDHLIRRSNPFEVQ
ncbi:MAG: selenocysteine-specific translation elongation factor [Burkholderiaceae bacterium]|nr:selenocysteine-specific translation elongation factor [Burkholderiaceae bacterium]